MHNINRDNYETWLMLYLDNELAVSERRAVEAFCTANPDVQEEFDGLKEVMLQPDLPVVMPGKERLLMPELWNEEALTRQQQQLLMLADNELQQDEKVVLENEMESSPLLQKEWDLLQKTVIGVSIPSEMPGKESLYKRENARVIPFGRILRIAAAAAILGFGWFFTSELIQKPKADVDGPQLAVKDKIEIVPNNQAVNTIANGINGIDTASRKNENLSNSQTDIANIQVEKNKAGKTIPSEKVELSNSTFETTREIVVASNTGNIPVEITNPDIVTKIPSITYVEVDGVDAIEPPILTQTAKVEPANAEIEPKTMQSYEVVNANDPDEEESISIAGARISKQKIRNVYRNITRPLARTFEKTPAPRTEVR